MQQRIQRGDPPANAPRAKVPREIITIEASDEENPPDSENEGENSSEGPTRILPLLTLSQTNWLTGEDAEPTLFHDAYEDFRSVSDVFQGEEIEIANGWDRLKCYSEPSQVLASGATAHPSARPGRAA